jgi:hypothetical protein
MAELAVPIPMTPRTFYTDTALSQNKAKMDAIGKTFYKEITPSELEWFLEHYVPAEKKRLHQEFMSKSADRKSVV